MRSLRVWILILLAFVIAAGCDQTVTERPRLTPVADPTQRLHLPGFSILPPRGENWFIVQVPPHPGFPDVGVITFGKKLREGPPAEPAEALVIFARVNVWDLEDLRFDSPTTFLQYMKEDFEKHLGLMVTARQRLRGFEATLDQSLGSMCVRYSRSAEYSGVPGFAGSIFLLTTRGFRCLHAHWPRYMIDVGYSQRYLQGQGPLLIDPEVEPFLKSLVFTSTRPMKQALGPERWASHMRAGNKAYKEGQYSQAQASFQASLDEAEKSFGPQDRRVAESLYYLGVVRHKQGQRAQAEPLYRRALDIYEKQPGADTVQVAQVLNDLGSLHSDQSRYGEAEALFRRALAIREKALPSDHRDLGQSLFNLMILYIRWGRHVEAEPFARRALPIYEKVKGREHPDVGSILHKLAHIYEVQGRFTDAEPLFKRALAIEEKARGPEHPEVAHHMEDYAALLRKMGREAEAKQMEARAKAVRAKQSN